MLEYVGVGFGVGRFIWDYRGKFYNSLVKTKIGKYIVIPFVLPWLIYVLFRMVNDPIMLKILDKVKKQRKINEYF